MSNLTNTLTLIGVFTLAIACILLYAKTGDSKYWDMVLIVVGFMTRDVFHKIGDDNKGNTSNE